MEAGAATAPGRDARAHEDQEEAAQARGEDAVVDVDRRGRDRRLLPVPVLLADQHLAEDRQRPAVVEPDPAATRRSTTTRTIFKNPDFTKALRNSAVVALSTTVLALAVGSFCAYALARLKLRGQVRDPRHRADDLDLPADRDRGAAVQAVVGHRALQHVDRADHPVPDLRAAAHRLHPRVVLQGDPEGPRGGGAGRRGDALRGVPQGRRAARGARPGHGRDPDLHRRLERVPAGGHADLVVEGPDGAGGDRVLHGRDRARGRRTAASRPHPWSSRCR